jgi:hypothetical protein
MLPSDSSIGPVMLIFRRLFAVYLLGQTPETAKPPIGGEQKGVS